MTTLHRAVRTFFDPLEAEQIREDLSSLRLVTLVMSVYFDLPPDVEVMPWLVEDVLSGKVYRQNETQIGAFIYNEMQALAWASGEHSDE